MKMLSQVMSFGSKNFGCLESSFEKCKIKLYSKSMKSNKSIKYDENSFKMTYLEAMEGHVLLIK